MAERIRAVLMCLSGLDTQDFIERVVANVPANRPLVLLYVIDTRPAEELGYIARRLHAGPRAGAGHEAMLVADEETAEAVLNDARAMCAQMGYDAERISLQTRRGRPEQEIIKAALEQRLDIGLVVVGSSYKRGPRPAIGPASIGHVARFVVDHSPCDVLMLK